MFQIVAGFISVFILFIQYVVDERNDIDFVDPPYLQLFLKCILSCA